LSTPDGSWRAPFVEREAEAKKLEAAHHIQAARTAAHDNDLRLGVVNGKMIAILLICAIAISATVILLLVT
jgi:hypothetical protein